MVLAALQLASVLEGTNRPALSAVVQKSVPILSVCAQWCRVAVLLAAPFAPGHAWAAVWGVRAVISLCLVMMALFLLVIPSYLPALLGIFNPGRATEVGVNALVGVFHQLGAGLVIWRTLSAAGAILSSILSSPQNLTAIFLAVVLSIAALRILHDVLVAERSSRYVSSA